MLVAEPRELLGEMIRAMNTIDVDSILEGQTNLFSRRPRDLLQEADDRIRDLLDNFGNTENVAHSPRVLPFP